MRAEYENSNHPRKYPKSFWECLVSKDFRSWVEAIRTELKSWIENGAFEVVDVDEVEDGANIIDVGELYLIKRSGKYKHRLYLRGDQQKKGQYFVATTRAVGSEIIRLLAGISVVIGRRIKGGDVITAYLLAEQRLQLYCFPPSHFDYLFADDNVLVGLRRKLLQRLDEEGPSYLKKLNRNNRFKQSKVLRILKAVYGGMDAGDSFQIYKEWAFEQAGAKRLFSEPAVYYFQEEAKDSSCNEEGKCNDDWFILFSNTDDFGYFGSSDEYEEDCKKRIEKHLKMEWNDDFEDYTSVQFKQCTDLGICELSQPKYWEQLAREFQIDVDKCRTFIPLPANAIFEESTPELHDEALKLGVKYLELVGALIYPACVCKLELKHAVSLLGSHMHDFTMQHYGYAVEVLKYGVTTRYMGLIFTRGLDPHGANVVYGDADSNFKAPRSTGGHRLSINGCSFLNTSKKHPTVDTSSTMAELSELFYCSLDVSAIRNFMEEIGMKIMDPTLVYQDNQPCIKIINQHKTSTSTVLKTMSIRTARLQEMVQEEQSLRVQWQETHKLVSDINTKLLPRPQFEYLRNILNGYALAMEKHPQWFKDRQGKDNMRWCVQSANVQKVSTSDVDDVKSFFANLV